MNNKFIKIVFFFYRYEEFASSMNVTKRRVRAAITSANTPPPLLLTSSLDVVEVDALSLND